MLFLWFYHACRRSSPRFMMVSDHINYLTFEDPGAVHTVRRALKLAHAGDLYGAAETAGVDVAHAAVVSEGLRKGMRFSIGAEVDNDPRSRPDAQNIVDAMRPDGIIRSVHFLSIDHPEKGADFMWPYDNAEFVHLWDHVGVERAWELYVDRLVDDIEKLPGHVVGHFYKPAVFGHWPDDAKLEQYEDRMLDAAAARGMAIEINSRPLYKDFPDEHRQKYIDVNKRLMRKAKAKNVGIAIGSDAHSPKDQGGAFDVVLQMLDECDINEIVFPVNGRLARVVLRATKEHIEAHRSPEPVQPGSSISGLGRAELGLPDEPDRPAEKIRETAASKTARDVGPKKRASSPARTTKKPASDEGTVTSSKRTPESAASSAKAKDSKSATKAAPAAKKAPEKKAAPEKKPPVAEKKPAAAEKKPAAAKKAAPVKKVAPVKKAVPVKKAAASAKKAAPAKKTPAKKAAPAAKKVASKKAAPKKLAAKPAAKPVAKKAAKPAAKPPAKSAKKSASPARPVKKASKPSSKGTTKKKTQKKR